MPTYDLPLGFWCVIGNSLLNSWNDFALIGVQQTRVSWVYGPSVKKLQQLIRSLHVRIFRIVLLLRDPIRYVCNRACVHWRKLMNYLVGQDKERCQHGIHMIRGLASVCKSYQIAVIHPGEQLILFCRYAGCFHFIDSSRVVDSCADNLNPPKSPCVTHLLMRHNIPWPARSARASVDPAPPVAAKPTHAVSLDLYNSFFQDVRDPHASEIITTPAQQSDDARDDKNPAIAGPTGEDNIFDRKKFCSAIDRKIYAKCPAVPSIFRESIRTSKEGILK